MNLFSIPLLLLWQRLLPAGLQRLFLAIVAVSLTASAQAQSVVVHVYDFDFSLNPQGGPVVDPVINVGDTVSWVWDQGVHSTTAASGQSLSWDSGDHSPGFQFDFTFTQPGSFNYYCDIHGFDAGGGNVGGMAGTITVVPEPAAQAVIVGFALIVFVLIRRNRLTNRAALTLVPPGTAEN